MATYVRLASCSCIHGRVANLEGIQALRPRRKTVGHSRPLDLWMEERVMRGGELGGSGEKMEWMKTVRSEMVFKWGR